MAKLIAWLDTRTTNKEGYSCLYLRTYLNGEYVHVSLNIDIKPVNWDKEAMMITGGEKRKENNLIIKEAIGRAADIILKYKVNKSNLTKDLFLKEFKNPSVITEFYEYMEYCIRSRPDLSDSTRPVHLSVVTKLREFRNKLLIIEVDRPFLEAYNKYLLNKGQKINTVHKDMKIIRTYINMALRDELIKKSPFEVFKPKQIKTFATYLTIQERDRLKDMYAENNLQVTIKETLRQFLFTCYTGLRVSDLKLIKYEQIAPNGILTYIPKKTKNVTGNKIEISIPEYAKKLIYNDVCTHEGFIFPHLAESKLNKTLKTIAQIATIQKNITMHVGRHTFATTFLQQCKSANGIIILQKILGHARLATTEVYLHVLNEDVYTAMNNFN